jgi:hypothetical protein
VKKIENKNTSLNNILMTNRPIVKIETSSVPLLFFSTQEHKYNFIIAIHDKLCLLFELEFLLIYH